MPYLKCLTHKIPENTGESKMTRNTMVATKMAHVLLSEDSLRSIVGPSYELLASYQHIIYQFFTSLVIEKDCNFIFYFNRLFKIAIKKMQF
jgi:hypothetical protein